MKSLRSRRVAAPEGGGLGAGEMSAEVVGTGLAIDLVLGLSFVLGLDAMGFGSWAWLGLTGPLLLLGAILVHEAMHAIVGAGLGRRPRRLMVGVGTVAQWRTGNIEIPTASSRQ